MTSYRTVDVKGDGSCFFRSLFVVLHSNKIIKKFILKTSGEEVPKMTEEEFVVFCRGLISTRIYLQGDYDVVKNAYNALNELDRADYMAIINSSFPSWFTKTFKNLPKTLDAFRKELAKEVLIKSHWVSQIEVTLIREMLKRELSINLMILNGSPIRPYTFHKNTVYMINRGEVHYNALIVISKEQKVKSPSNSKEQKVKSPSNSKEQKKKKPIKPIKTKKECLPTQLMNPKTNRCVSRTSCKGYELLAKNTYIKSN